MMENGAENSANGKTVIKMQKRKGVKAGIYLLPNLITATSFFCGFLAIKIASDGRYAANPELSMQAFVNAAYLILIAGVADGLDGSVARLTRTQSNFGVQFDSLSDLVSFGVAPAVLAYQFILHDLSRIGFAAAFVFAAAGALRLARFNVQSSVGKTSGNFTGIPIPMGAAPVAVYILAQDTLQSWASTAPDRIYPLQQKIAIWLTSPQVNGVFLFIMMILLAVGMVSTFEYISTKTIRLPRKRPFVFFSMILMTLILLFGLDFTVTLAVLLLAYCLHGPILWLFFKKDKAAEEEELFSNPDEEEEEIQG